MQMHVCAKHGCELASTQRGDLNAHVCRNTCRFHEKQSLKSSNINKLKFIFFYFTVSIVIKIFH